MAVGECYLRDGVRYYASNAENEVRYKKSPEGDAGFLGQLFMTWLTPLILVVYRSKLEIQDALPLRSRDNPTQLYSAFGREWLVEFKCNGKAGPSVTRAMWRVFRRRVFQSLFWKTWSIAVELVGPVILHMLLIFLDDSHREFKSDRKQQYTQSTTTPDNS
jgi:hypothetical protein